MKKNKIEYKKEKWARGVNLRASWWVTDFFGRQLTEDEFVYIREKVFDNQWIKNSKGELINYNDFFRLMLDNDFYKKWKMRNNYVGMKFDKRKNILGKNFLTKEEIDNFMKVFKKYILNHYNPKGYTELEIENKALKLLKNSKRGDIINYQLELDEKMKTLLYKECYNRRGGVYE